MYPLTSSPVLTYYLVTSEKESGRHSLAARFGTTAIAQHRLRQGLEEIGSVSRAG
jgi:hypothetical protein